MLQLVKLANVLYLQHALHTFLFKNIKITPSIRQAVLELVKVISRLIQKKSILLYHGDTAASERGTFLMRSTPPNDCVQFEEGQFLNHQ